MINMINKDLPKKIPVFPLSNFIIFPKTTVPLNIFEPRYIQMVDDSMKNNRYTVSYTHLTLPTSFLV